MKLNLPPRVRVAIYVFSALGTPVVTYLFDAGIIGVREIALWSAEMAVVFAMAGLNVTKPED